MSAERSYEALSERRYSALGALARSEKAERLPVTNAVATLGAVVDRLAERVEALEAAAKAVAAAEKPKETNLAGTVLDLLRVALQASRISRAVGVDEMWGALQETREVLERARRLAEEQGLYFVPRAWAEACDALDRAGYSPAGVRSILIESKALAKDAAQRLAKLRAGRAWSANLEEYGGNAGWVGWGYHLGDQVAFVQLLTDGEHVGKFWTVVCREDAVLGTLEEAERWLSERL